MISLADAVACRRSALRARVARSIDALRRCALAALAVGLLSCLGACSVVGTLVPQVATDAASIAGADLVIVAVADRPEARPTPGSAVRVAGYNRPAGYAGSGLSLQIAKRLAGEHGLTEVKAWTIPTLDLRCMLYRLPAGASRDELLAALAADPQVALAQPLNTFETQAGPPGPAPRTTAAAPAAYNDPYVSLQSGFLAIDAAGAQRVTRGEGTLVAVIDTGIDQGHPDLRGRVALARDFVGRPDAGERHGTEVAGVIAATANNGLGIVGVAPATRVLSFRSCWAMAAGEPSRCNSFTLAQALVAAMAAGADVINLSLAGPRDPLLERLARQALDRGIVVVGALPLSGRREGFPSGVADVLAVGVSEGANPSSAHFSAPGRRILTLVPGGSYDYASGSSLATAHLSGAAALLRSVNRQLDASAMQRLLRNDDGRAVDACRALQRLDPSSGHLCAAPR